jgi:disulfide oxidoreductase YuzD
MLFDPSSKDEDFESHMNSKLDGLASGIDLPFVYLVGWRNNDTTNWVPCVERKSSNNHRQCEWVDINSNDDTAKHEFVGKLLHALLPVLGKQVIVAKSARKT